jgi:hypothetical protein
LLSPLPELAILIGILRRVGLLALTAWILLLLARLLATALLLTGLLARILVLLTRVLILSAHSEISLVLTLTAVNGRAAVWLLRNIGSSAAILWRCTLRLLQIGTGSKLPMHKTFKPQPPLLPRPGSNC